MKGKVTCELLNVRKTPEKADNVLDVLGKGTELLIIDHENGWMRIQAGNTDGYVMDKFVAAEMQETPEPGQDDAKDQDNAQDPGQDDAKDQDKTAEPPKEKPKKKEKGGEDEQTGATE